MDTLLLLRMGNKIPMEGVTETKFGAEIEGKTIQRLPHLGIHPVYNHQTQTLLHMPERFCWQDSDIVPSCEAMPMPGKYRSGCSQSSIRWNTGYPIKELEKVPKELKWSADLSEKQYELTNMSRAHVSSCICSRRWPSRPSLDREAPWSCKLYIPRYRGNPTAKKWELVGRGGGYRGTFWTAFEM